MRYGVRQLLKEIEDTECQSVRCRIGGQSSDLDRPSGRITTHYMDTMDRNMGRPRGLDKIGLRLNYPTMGEGGGQEVDGS